VLIALSAPACSSSAHSPASAVEPTITSSYLSQFKTQVLTDNGFALYIFQPDHHQQATCKSYCAAIWPPMLLSPDQHATASPGIHPSLLGTDPYSSNSSIATYNGWPLYGYASETTVGAAAGQGLDVDGGYWYVIRPDGTPIVPSGDPPAS
jgi:predicted lipoprotein with Yx(FWY)xxD motif